MDRNQDPALFLRIPPMADLYKSLAACDSKIFTKPLEEDGVPTLIEMVSHLSIRAQDIVGAKNNLLYQCLRYGKNDAALMAVLLNYCYHNLSFACHWLLRVDIMELQHAILHSMWTHSNVYLCGTRGLSKTFMLALFAILKAMLVQGSRVVVVSESFRQSKHVFNYINTTYENSPILRQLGGKDGYPRVGVDSCVYKIGTSTIKCLPLGNGETIRGERASDILIDECQLPNWDVLNQVVVGFGVVSHNPVRNVIQRALQSDHLFAKYEKRAKEVYLQDCNKIILSGTADFEFNDAFKKYDLYRKIIATKGDKNQLRELLGDSLDEEQLGRLKWTDYAVLTVPYDVVPPGYMDEPYILNAKVDNPQDIFDMEFRCIWLKDTNGFIPMSLIQQRTRGKCKKSSNAKCVMGVDPARSGDNLAITIAELDEESQQAHVVYTWSFNEERLKKEFEYSRFAHYGFWTIAAIKILYLVKTFNVVSLAMDKGGGGTALLDILRAPATHSIPSDLYSRPIVEPGDISVIEGKSAVHDILHLIKFENSLVNEMNMKFKRDIEQGVVWFPSRDAKGFMGQSELFDVMDDDIEMIENEVRDMKREISIVKIIRIGDGSCNHRFDTGTGGHKPKKDRYTSCLLAHKAWDIWKENNEASQSLTYSALSTVVHK